MPQVEVMERKDLSSLFRPVQYDSNLPALVEPNQGSLRISDVSQALHNRNQAAIRAEAERLRREKEQAQQERLRVQSSNAEPMFYHD